MASFLISFMLPSHRTSIGNTVPQILNAATSSTTSTITIHLHIIHLIAGYFSYGIMVLKWQDTITKNILLRGCSSVFNRNVYFNCTCYVYH